MLNSINGIILPGGWTTLQPGNGYYDGVTKIYKIAKEINDKGIFFPILGICLGFEAMLITSNGHRDVQKYCHIIDEYYPLIFNLNFRQSLLFSKIPEDVYIALKYFDTTANFHKNCTSSSDFNKAGLNKEWNILSINFNRRGFEFISSVEHKKYPFMGVQFHPERHVSPWNSGSSIPYSRAAVKANRYFYDTLIDWAKDNNNKFKNEKEEKESLFVNYSPLFWDRKKSYAQMYAFSN